jgi:hypothetical protein
MELPEGNYQAKAVTAVISAWAQRDPQAASNWVLQLPDSELRVTGVHDVMSTWARQDPDQAETWAKSLSEGPMRDAAVNSYIDSAAYWTPAKAADLVGAIGDPAKREESAAAVVRVWWRIDRAQAQAWLEQTAFSDQFKQTLLSSLPAN